MTATIATPASVEVVQIPIERLLPSEDNPRKTIDTKDLAQLAISIRQLGIQVPLLVRPLFVDKKDSEFRYEIVSGHRRHAASQMADLASVPCIIREMSDGEAREIALIENLQREDLPLLEEADAYEGLLPSLGTAANIAARVGKSIEHVTCVLKLRTLTPFSRQALADRLITIDHALLLAKLGVLEQEKALRFTLRPSNTRKDKTEDLLASAVKDRENDDRYSYWEPQSVLHLKSFIERDIKLELKRAPWDLSDATLVPAAGACAGCPKNTAANTALFGDLAVEEASCTDAICFAEKRKVFVQIQINSIEAASVDALALRLSWKSSSSKPRFEKDSGKVSLTQIFKDGQWIVAEKNSCPNVRTGVTIDFYESLYGIADAKKKPGMTLSVCVEAGCKTHKKEWEKASALSYGNAYDAKAEEEKRKKRAEAALVENKLRLHTAGPAIDKIVKLPMAELRFLLAEALRRANFGKTGEAMKALLPAIRKYVESSSLESAEFSKAIAVIALAESNLQITEWQAPDFERKAFLARMKSLGVDASSAWTKKPEPKASTRKAKVSPAPSVKAATKPKASPRKVLSPARRKAIAAAEKTRLAKARMTKKGGVK